MKSEASGATKNYEEASPGLKYNQSLRAQLDLAKLAPRFVYSIRGTAEVEGRDCWVVGYRPKAGASAGSREEKVINALQGQLWIDKETFAILRCDGKSVEPVKVALIATVDSLEFSYQSQRPIKWRGRPPIFRRRHDAEGSVFLCPSATSLYAQQLSRAAGRLNTIASFTDRSRSNVLFSYTSGSSHRCHCTNKDTLEVTANAG